MESKAIVKQINLKIRLKLAAKTQLWIGEHYLLENLFRGSRLKHIKWSLGEGLVCLV